MTTPDSMETEHTLSTAVARYDDLRARDLLAPATAGLDDDVPEPGAAPLGRDEALELLALGEVMAGRTTFVIAHRLSTIALADEIVVLEHGRVAAHGSHEELLEESPLYREIVEKGMPDQVFMTRKSVGAVGL